MFTILPANSLKSPDVVLVVVVESVGELGARAYCPIPEELCTMVDLLCQLAIFISPKVD